MIKIVFSRSRMPKPRLMPVLRLRTGKSSSRLYVEESEPSVTSQSRNEVTSSVAFTTMRSSLVMTFWNLKKSALVSAWSTQAGAGFVDVGSCEPASINYVAGYTAKKVGLDDPDELRSRCSINPPIGYNWLRLYRDDVHRTGGIVINGQLRPIPDLFKERDPVGLRHVIADKRNYAKSNFTSESQLVARAAHHRYKNNQRVLKEST